MDETQALGTYTQPRALSRRDGSDKLRGRHERERARVSLALARAVHRTPWKAVNFRLSSEKSAGLGLDRRRSRLSRRARFASFRCRAQNDTSERSRLC